MFVMTVISQTRSSFIAWACDFNSRKSAFYSMTPEEVGHNFLRMCILLSRIIYNVLFLLTQRVDLVCIMPWAYIAAYGKCTLIIIIRIHDQPPLEWHNALKGHAIKVVNTCFSDQSISIMLLPLLRYNIFFLYIIIIIIVYRHNTRPEYMHLSYVCGPIDVCKMTCGEYHDILQ